ncbi:MAG: hypothetical protein RIR39_1670 [Pseudomonadota bacterium]|jgi:lysozyme family protein
MSVKDLINEIIKIEGGYVNHPNDKGGPTKHGITIKTLYNWRDDAVTALDVELLTKDEAFKIYQSEYYLKPKINTLPSLVQPVVFDMAVNMGPVASIKLMQGVVHKMGTPVKIDGHIGPMTVQSAKTACGVYGDDVLRQIAHARIEYYRKIVENDSSQMVFLAGWINRAEKFKHSGVKVA